MRKKIFVFTVAVLFASLSGLAYVNSVAPGSDVESVPPHQIPVYTGKLNIEDAIKTVNGIGVRKIFVFSHPDCVFCQQLEKELSLVKDLTVYTFIVGGQSAKAQENSRRLWCKELKNRNQPCDDSALKRNEARMAEFRFDGTPTIVNSKGYFVKGMLTAQSIDSFAGG